MSETQLRRGVLKLAHKHPEFRSVLLGALKQATLKNSEIGRMIDAYKADPSDHSKSELSEVGLGQFRDECRKMGHDRSDMQKLMQEELKRVRGFPASSGGLVRYLKTPRVGSPYRMSRAMRSGLFAQFVAKGAIR